MKIIANYLSILIIAFIGADRINLLSSDFDFFVFTPYILFSILFIIIVLLFQRNNLQFDWFLNSNISTNIFIIYILTLLFSTFFSIDIYLSLKRLVLIVFILGVTFIILSLYNKKQFDEILYKGSVLGSLLFLFFNFILSINWFFDYDLSTAFINLNPDGIAYFVPRFGGYTADVNRGTIVLLFFTYIIYYSSSKSKYVKYILLLNLIFIIMSFSRTAYLMMFVMFLRLLFVSDKENKIRILRYTFALIFISLALLLYLDLNSFIDFKLLLSERLSVFEITRFTSSGIHLKLIIEGIYTAFNDFKILLIGAGYGTSYHLIEGYYWSGVKYGNYHSMYITSLVECGLLNCLSLLVFTIIWPLYYSNKNFITNFILGMFIFNIFYQLNVEPVFWFTIFLFYKTTYLDEQEI